MSALEGVYGKIDARLNQENKLISEVENWKPTIMANTRKVRLMNEKLAELTALNQVKKIRQIGVYAGLFYISSVSTENYVD